ncbi:Interleukin-12 receptor subunit beta-2 [Bagarius yarrelli]|uniref:Interleukin-12 receptor subunit beta-2 n=1 Tax=Bagarius yarrelli TaxID=175774 RepID=A0A556TY13_BAGYA|nr:Interleukin-12 receptor subunit beta-2 [Bagarius yarrelli]
MNIFRDALRFVLLLFTCKLIDCYKVTCNGELTLDRDIIPIGSNLTVHCRSDTVKCGRLFIMTFNKKEILRKTSCSSVTAHVVVNEPKSLIYCSVVQERKSYIVCGRDIIANPIPSRPQIEAIVFPRDSLSPIIHWHSTDNMENLKPSLRFRIAHDSSDWMGGNMTERQKDALVLLVELEPLTSYEFELKVCTATMRNNCSLWSKSFSQTSPGKSPSTKLNVWRTITNNEWHNTQNVTLMWQPLGTEDLRGVLHHYEIVYKLKGTTNILNCSTARTLYTLQLPLEVTELNVSAVTSAGSSPPALVRLTCSAGIPSPEIKSSHAAGGSVNLMWDSPRFSAWTSEQMLGFVVQWQCTQLQVQWRRYDKNYNSLYIQAPRSNLCNISLYVESSDRVSCPSFKQIQMINKDTDKIQALDKKVGRVEMLKMPFAGTKNGLVVAICLITAVPVVVIVNLMYMKCTRQRLRKACMSMGPSWLFQNLPKLGNSNAIKLLKDERCSSDLCWQPVDIDPPLSPVEDYSPSVERKDLYPTVHKEVTTEETAAVQDWTVCPYKPQITISLGAEVVCEISEKEEDDPPWVFFSSPVVSPFEHFVPSQGIQGSLPNCLTVDGRPVSMDLVDGFHFFTQTALDENNWTDETFAETGNQNQHQTQTVT